MSTTLNLLLLLFAAANAFYIINSPESAKLQTNAVLVKDQMKRILDQLGLQSALGLTNPQIVIVERLPTQQHMVGEPAAIVKRWVRSWSNHMGNTHQLAKPSKHSDESDR